jgi:hypothetical protein
MQSIFDTIPTLEHWERQLLLDLEIVDLEVAQEEATVWEAIATQACHIATDGSAPDGKGSFAWVISDAEGNILAQCKGPAYGADISSYRAEGYGILSVLRFLVHMRKIHPLQDGLPVVQQPLVCDNEAIVKKIREIIKYKSIYPNSTMESDWDILAEIRSSMLE